MPPRVVVPTLALSALLGCSEPFTVEDLAGTYALSEMDARPLPQLLTASVNCDEWVQGGELSLQPSGEFRLTVQGELDCTRAGGQVQAIGWEYPGTFTVAGTILHFVAPSYPSGSIEFTGQAEPFRNRIHVSELELHQSTGVELEFRR